ncbi:MAG: glucose-6-phosphate isomerase, partial [Novosphingobium sp.]
MDDAVGAIWQRLSVLPRPRLSELFARDGGRVGQLSARLELGETGILFDWSKTHLDAAHLDIFAELAAVMDFSGKRAALFAGDIVNLTENRAAEHTAQRGLGKETSVEEAVALHARMRSLVEAIHAGALGEIRHLIHIGIGGSALGPALAVDALSRDGAEVDVHVVSNIDGLALEAACAACDPAATLIAVASKTFTTVETMTNAASALGWLETNGVADPYGRVVALTAYPDKAVEWGVDETRVLPFQESVGGRYSLWSSIGFPVALALGWHAFAVFLVGAAA